jgi:hypothetical protein
MKKTVKEGAIILFLTLFVFSSVACFGQNNAGKAINSADALKEYLDNQPANSPDKPINIKMKVNETMLPSISHVISGAGKYVNLDLSGSPLTAIPEEAFRNNKNLSGITIPNDVTSIDWRAFSECSSLASINISSYDKTGTKYVEWKSIYFSGYGVLYRYYENEYDSKGNLTKQSVYHANGYLESYYENEYDSKGYWIKESRHDADRDLESYYEIERDSKGNLTKANCYDANGDLKSYYENEYDSKGNLTKASYYDANGNLESYVEYECDSKGNIKMWSSYYANGELSFKSRNEYEYDSRGNKTKERQYDANGSLTGYYINVWKKL